MFLIYNFIFWHQIAKSAEAHQILGLSQPADVPELTSYLNEIRTGKDLNEEKDTFYNEMIQKSQKLDECHKNLMTYALWLQNLIKKEYDRAISRPIAMRQSEWSAINKLIIAVYTQFLEQKKGQDNFVSEIMVLVKKDIFRTVFTNLEEPRILSHLIKSGCTLYDIESKIKEEYEKIKNLHVVMESEENNSLESNPR